MKEILSGSVQTELKNKPHHTSEDELGLTKRATEH